jgi:alpha,alpha-trehalase
MTTVLAEHLAAVIFDLDGVVTDTAAVHAAAWKRLFDDYLHERAMRHGGPFVPFTERDYREFVDGKPRYDGAASFLQSRGISLRWGDPADDPNAESVCGLANRKNALFNDVLRAHGVQVFATSVDLIRTLRARGFRTAVVTASRNGRQVLEQAGITDLFDAVVDGVLAAHLGLPGKPDPATFLEAARRLAVEPTRAAVVEDALSGVEAGRRGGFALVIGVDRVGQADSLRRHGADIVVSDLAELGVPDTPRPGSHGGQP